MRYALAVMDDTPEFTPTPDPEPVPVAEPVLPPALAVTPVARPTHSSRLAVSEAGLWPVISGILLLALITLAVLILAGVFSSSSHHHGRFGRGQHFGMWQRFESANGCGSGPVQLGQGRGAATTAKGSSAPQGNASQRPVQSSAATGYAQVGQNCRQVLPQGSSGGVLPHGNAGSVVPGATGTGANAGGQGGGYGSQGGRETQGGQTGSYGGAQGGRTKSYGSKTSVPSGQAGNYGSKASVPSGRIKSDGSKTIFQSSSHSRAHKTTTRLLPSRAKKTRR